jgi:hypothetical protein
MNPHRINHKPQPEHRPSTVLDISLCIGIAAGLVLSILQPYGAIW